MTQELLDYAAGLGHGLLRDGFYLVSVDELNSRRLRSSWPNKHSVRQEHSLRRERVVDVTRFIGVLAI